MEKRLSWKDQPDDRDYPAAQDYLSLVADDDAAHKLVARLREAPIVHRKAKDLLRASGLPVLPADNVHVAKDLSKVHNGQPLSPVLLVRGDVRRAAGLTIADGYHRVCASYHLDEDANIFCRIVDLATN